MATLIIKFDRHLLNRNVRNGIAKQNFKWSKRESSCWVWGWGRRVSGWEPAFRSCRETEVLPRYYSEASQVGQSQASGPRPSFHARQCSSDTQSNLSSLRTEILPWAPACISFLDHPSTGLLTMPPSKQKNFPFTPCFSAVMGHSRSPTQRVRALCTEGWG